MIMLRKECLSIFLHFLLTSTSSKEFIISPRGQQCSIGDPISPSEVCQCISLSDRCFPPTLEESEMASEDANTTLSVRTFSEVTYSSKQQEIDDETSTDIPEGECKRSEACCCILYEENSLPKNNFFQVVSTRLAEPAKILNITVGNETLVIDAIRVDTGMRFISKSEDNRTSPICKGDFGSVLVKGESVIEKGDLILDNVKIVFQSGLTLNDGNIYIDQCSALVANSDVNLIRGSINNEGDLQIFREVSAKKIDPLKTDDFISRFKVGSIFSNHGNIDEIGHQATLQQNYGKVAANYGTIVSNGGYVNVTYGSVIDNQQKGFIEMASSGSSIVNNHGTIVSLEQGVSIVSNSGTIEENYGTVVTNHGTILNNTLGGSILINLGKLFG